MPYHTWLRPSSAKRRKTAIWSVAMGLYSLILMMAAIVLTCCCVGWNQRLAPYFLGSGLLLFGAWMLTIYSHYFVPYDVTGVNIYVAFILAMVLCVAGGIGLVVKGLRILLNRLGHSKAAPM